VPGIGLCRDRSILRDQAFAVPGPAQFKQFRTGTVYHFLDTLVMF